MNTNRPPATELLSKLQTRLARELRRSRQLNRQLAAANQALLTAHNSLAKTLVSERRAHDFALHDALTFLPNRRFLEQRLDGVLDACVTAPTQVAVLFIDLDDFKSINDKYGHHVGDALLLVVSERLKHIVRAEDFVSRLGGDEFVCVLCGLAAPERLRALATQMINAVHTPCSLGSLILQVRPSIGIALFPGDGLSRPALLRNADQAMYRAKLSRSGYAFANEPGAALLSRGAGSAECIPHSPMAS